MKNPIHILGRKKILTVLIFACVLGMHTAHASIVETEFKVTGYHVTPTGDLKKLPKTRAFITYDNNANIFSAGAREHCQVAASKKDFKSLWNTPNFHPCVSNKTYVVTEESAIMDLLLNPTSYDLLHNSLAAMSALIVNGAVVANTSENNTRFDTSILNLVKTVFRRAEPVQTISLVQSTSFELKGKFTEKFVIQLTPVVTKILAP